jgi:hypothetical protein
MLPSFYLLENIMAELLGSEVMQKLRNNGKHEPTIDRTTLLVYWYILEHEKNDVGIRSVQRALGFKSPSSAIFHLEKLNAANLLSKERSGRYVLIKRSKYGLMRYFVFFDNKLVPKPLFHALIVSAATALAVIFLSGFWQLAVILALLPSILASAILWMQTYNLWKAKPKFKKS